MSDTDPMLVTFQPPAPVTDPAEAEMDKRVANLQRRAWRQSSHYEDIESKDVCTQLPKRPRLNPVRTSLFGFFEKLFDESRHSVHLRFTAKRVVAMIV